MNPHTFDPHDMANMSITTLDHLEQDPVYQLAQEVARDVQALYPYVRERPRYEAIHDQCQRASSSVALNFAQGFSKMRGFTKNDWMVSRGELAETYAALSLLPKDVADDIKVKVRILMKALDARINSLVEKCDRPYYKS